MTDYTLLKDLNEDANSLISLRLLEFREREPMVDGDPEEVLAPHKVKDLQVLIRKGAKDMDQDWKTPEHLVNKAYKVQGHTIPSPDMKEGWEQYEYLIGFTVGVLGNIRGPFAKWRRTEPKIPDPESEAVEAVLKKMPGYVNPNDIGK
jgi:hypothetical protein